MQKVPQSLIIVLLCACTLSHTPPTITIALLAPFEGRFREIGYNALYATRLAFEDEQASSSSIELLAIDDGGSDELALDRARGLAQNPDIAAIIALGPFATRRTIAEALAPRPVLVVGMWNTEPPSEHSYLMFNPAIIPQITSLQYITDLPNTPIIGGDILGLHQIRLLAPNPEEIAFLSSSQLPDATFEEKYRNSGAFVPEPNHLATLTYDTTRLLIRALSTQTHIDDIEYNGINGHIYFENQHWTSAPIWMYRYRIDGQLYAELISASPQ